MPTWTFLIKDRNIFRILFYCLKKNVFDIDENLRTFQKTKSNLGIKEIIKKKLQNLQRNIRIIEHGKKWWQAFLTKDRKNWFWSFF